MMPLMKWHECKECGKVTIRIKGARGTYRGDYCGSCSQWMRRGGHNKVGTFRICPETGEKVWYIRDRGAHRRFIDKKIALKNKRRRNSRTRRMDPEKKAKELARNEKRYYKYRSEGKCPRCGEVPDSGVLCENCKDRSRRCNNSNRRS